MPHGPQWHNPLPAWLEDLQPPLKPYQRVILQEICNRCDAKPINGSGDRGYCWVGAMRLGQRTGMSKRTAQRHVKHLLGAGMLTLHKRGGIDWRTGEVFPNTYGIPGKPPVKAPEEPDIAPNRFLCGV